MDRKPIMPDESIRSGHKHWYAAAILSLAVAIVISPILAFIKAKQTSRWSF